MPSAPTPALQLVAEIGTDMSRWPTAKHFTSWLTLAPNNKISGGRLLIPKTQPSANRAAAILRRCAMSLTRTSTALGQLYRRLAARAGKATAITATARKLATLVYRVLRGDLAYSDPGADAYAQLHRARALKTLRKRARQLGFSLVNVNSGELLPTQAVSLELRHGSMASFSCSGSQCPKPPYRATCPHQADGQHSRGGPFFAIKPSPSSTTSIGRSIPTRST